MKRKITGLTAAGPMTLGDLRQFVASLEGLPDAATVKARVSLRRRLRSVTVEEDDLGFDDYLRAVGGGTDEEPARTSRGGNQAKDANASTSL